MNWETISKYEKKNTTPIKRNPDLFNGRAGMQTKMLFKTLTAKQQDSIKKQEQ